jgi:ribonuclease Z
VESSVLKVGGLTLHAVSVAGKETCIEVPSWKLAFDIGRCPPSSVRAQTVLFTHSHIDHMGGVAHHLGLRGLQRMSPPKYVVPAEHVGAFGALLDAWRQLDRSDLKCAVQGVRPGDEVPLGAGRSALVFRAMHRVAAVGYAVVERRAVLRSEWRGRPGPEIGAARTAGVSVTEDVVETVLAFCGDTTIDVVDREPLVRSARVLLLECTFLGETSAQRATDGGHIHLDQIAARAGLFENEVIVLTHFSSRYSTRQILEAIAGLPESLRQRVVPLLPGPPWGR